MPGGGVNDDSAGDYVTIRRRGGRGGVGRGERPPKYFLVLVRLASREEMAETLCLPPYLPPPPSGATAELGSQKADGRRAGLTRTVSSDYFRRQIKAPGSNECKIAVCRRLGLRFFNFRTKTLFPKLVNIFLKK